MGCSWNISNARSNHICIIVNKCKRIILALINCLLYNTHAQVIFSVWGFKHPTKRVRGDIKYLQSIGWRGRIYRISPLFALIVFELQPLLNFLGGFYLQKHRGYYVCKICTIRISVPSNTHRIIRSANRYKHYIKKLQKNWIKFLNVNR